MQRRIILISSIALQCNLALAESDGWQCDQSQQGNQWGCVSTIPPKATAPAQQPASVSKILSNTLAQPQKQKAKAINPSQPTLSVKPTSPVSQQSAPSTPAISSPAAKLAPVLKPPAATVAPVNRPEPAKAAPDPEAPPPIIVAPAGSAIEDKPTQSSCTSQPTAAHCVKVSQAQTNPVKSDNQAAATDSNDSFELFTPTFSRAQEQIFNRLQTRLKADPWQGCENSAKTPNPYNTIVSNPALRDTAPMDVDSDYSEIFDKVVTSFSGNVKIDRADQNMLADKVNYNSASNTLDAQGHVFYKEDEISLFSQSLLLNLNTDEARLRDALFISPRGGIRGSAKVVYQENKDFSHYKDVAYTSCPPGNQDWIIHAARFKMNKLLGKGGATDAWLEFKGIPLLYSPYLSFPLDSRRKTGFLAPTWATTGQSGISITVPFYWNIAPNYDALFKARYLAKRGLMMGGELRYLNTFSNNKLSMEVLPYDANYDDKTRFQSSFKHQSLITPHLSSNVDLNYVSDKKYISDLGNALSFTDIRHIRSVADLNYQREDGDFLTRVENYQTIDQSIPNQLRPYRKLPQVALNLHHSFEKMPVNIGMNNEFTVFQHSYNVDGQRFNIQPYVSAPLKSDSFFAVPKVSFLHTNYILNNQYAGYTSNISRDLPVLSFDTGLFAEGTFDLFGKGVTHTLEPRLFYLYIPKSQQDQQPVFDSSIYDTNFDSLFRENRFSSIDRIQNANQVTVALTSRLLDADSGIERFKLSVGDIIYFQDRQAQSLLTGNTAGPASIFPVTKDETNRFSNLVTEFSGQITNELSFTSGLQWDPYNNNLVRQQIDLHFRNRWGHIFNVGYLHRKNLNLSADPLTGIYDYRHEDQIKQSDVSFRLPIYDNWFAVGRWQYSFLYNQTAEGFFGFEKESCCWRFRIIGRHYINGLSLINNGTVLAPTNLNPAAIGTSQTTVMFQIELKSLSAFGDEIDTFLKQNIYGYNNL